MKLFKKTIAMIVVICSLLTNIAYGDINAFKLAVPSRMKDMEFKSAAQATMSLHQALKDVKNLDLAAIRALEGGEMTIAENTVFASKITGKILFRNARVEESAYIIPAEMNGQRYYCFVLTGDHPEVTVLPARIAELGNAMHAEDRRILDEYIGHEVSTQTYEAIDPWIAGKMESGEYALDNITGEGDLYKGRGKRFDRANYENVVALQRQFLVSLGVKDADSIINAKKEAAFVLIPYNPKSEKLPSARIDGQLVTVYGHSSQFATYIFIPYDVFNRVTGQKPWPSDAARMITEIDIHETGARCGENVKVTDGGVQNILDRYYKAASQNAQTLRSAIENDGTEERLRDLHPVNLLYLELRNDYAAGYVLEKKSIFKRYMRQILIALGIMAVVAGGITEYTIMRQDPAVVYEISIDRQEMKVLYEKAEKKVMDRYWRDSSFIYHVSDELARTGKPAVQALIEILNDNRERPESRAIAALALGKIGGEKALYALIETASAADGKNEYMGYFYPYLTTHVAEALGYPGDEKAVPVLAKLLCSREEGYELAIHYPGRVTGEQKIWAINGALKMIGEKIGKEKVVDTLIKNMESDSWYARLHTIEALKSMGSAKALPALRGAVNDENERVRNAAKYAIERIEGAQQGKDRTNPAEKRSGLVETMEEEKVAVKNGDAALERLWNSEAAGTGNADIDRKMTLAAMPVLAALGVFAFPKPESDSDIQAIAARVREHDIEVFMPRSQFPKETLQKFRDGLGRTFGDRLRVYDSLADLALMIKDPARSVVMTVDLSDEQVAYAKDILGDLKDVRFMNFEAINIKELISQGAYENYIQDTLSKLLVARVITQEEANDESSPSYRMLAHLLSGHLPREEIGSYIRQIADNEMDIVKKMRNLIRQILKAMPVEAYKDEQLKPAIQVLWAA